MCSPLHASFLSTGRPLPAAPPITDDEQRPGALAGQPGIEGDPDRPGAGWAPAPGSKGEIERV